MNNEYESLSRLNRLTGHQIINWVINAQDFAFRADDFLDQSLGIPLSTLTRFDALKDFIEKDNWPDFDQQEKNLFTYKSKLDLRLNLKNSNKWLRIVGEYSQSSNTFNGFLIDITKDFERDQVHRNHNLELSAFEKGLEQFTIVARTDAQGKIIYANEEFCRLSQYKIDELLGKDHRIINSQYHPKEFFKGMWDSIHNGVIWKGLVKNKAKDGTFYWVETIVIPIQDTDGTLTEILSFRFDVTLLQAIKEENQKLKQELLEKN